MKPSLQHQLVWYRPHQRRRSVYKATEYRATARDAFWFVALVAMILAIFFLFPV